MNKKKWGGLLGVLSGIAGAIIAANQPHKPAQPWPTPAILAEWDATCHAVVIEQTTREITPSELQECIGKARGGAQASDLSAWASTLPKPEPPPPPAPSVITLDHLTTDGPIFRAGGQPWRWKGVSAFALLNRFAKGEDITDTLNAYQGFNLLRVWPYVPRADWKESAWDSPDAATINRFVAYVNARGFYVELTLLTDDDPARLARAKALVPQLDCSTGGLLLEAGNEPTTHKHIDTPALRGVLAASGCLYASGDYEDSARAAGSYLVAHPSRTPDFPRRAHDLYEFWTGQGPNTTADPPHHVPAVADEPAKIQDVGTDVASWRAFFGAASLMGAGATWHSETGKYGLPPTPDEARIAAVALEAMNAFPADARLGAYRRIVEPGNEKGGPTENSRTYVMGNYMVRCQQRGKDAPESGWTAIDSDGILWRR